MTLRKARRLTAALGCLGVLLVAAPAQAVTDPFEAANRRIHGFNQQLRTHLLGPLAESYVAVTPPPWREGIARAASNLAEPITAVNGLIAGDPALARNAMARFAINSTLGRGGVRDVAAERGLPHRPLSLADAACSRGLPSGPYLVLPVLGPSTLRDAGAMAVTSAALAQLVGGEWLAGVGVGDGFVTYAARYETLRQVDEAALDSYAVLRSAYLQRRAATCAIDRAQLLALEAAEDSDDRLSVVPWNTGRTRRLTTAGTMQLRSSDPEQSPKSPVPSAAGLRAAGKVDQNSTRSGNAIPLRLWMAITL